jgi:hypothetical protein
VRGDPPFGTAAILDVLFGLMLGDGYDIVENARAFEDRLPADLLPVAQDPGGNLICIGVNGPRAGHVLFWDHNGSRSGRSDDESVYPVAASWSEFLNLLRRE